MRIATIAGPALALGLFAHPPAWGQAAAPAPAPAPTQQELNAASQRITTVIDQEAKDRSLFDFSYSSPNSPVLPLVGVASDSITRVDSLRKFGIGIIQGLGDGQSTGLAIDISPYWLLAEDRQTLYGYRKSDALTRIAARSKLGFAFAAGDKGTGQPSTFVASLSSKLFDSADGMLDRQFDGCINNDAMRHQLAALHDQITQQAADELSGLSVVPQDRAAVAQRFGEIYEQHYNAASTAQIQERYSRCIAESAKRTARRPSFDAGAGLRLRGEPGTIDHLRASGAIVWATWSSGVVGGDGGPGSTHSSTFGFQVLAHIRYTSREEVYDDKFVLLGKRDSLEAVAGIESVPAADPDAVERFRWGLQAGWHRQNAVLPTDKDENYWRYLAKADVRLGEGYWLNLSYGRADGTGINRDSRVLVGFTIDPKSFGK